MTLGRARLSSVGPADAKNYAETNAAAYLYTATFFPQHEVFVESSAERSLLRLVAFLECRDQDWKHHSILRPSGLGLHGNQRWKVEHAKQASFIGH